eukprot:scaffold163378_cov25-Tisochrysis_lutea.AAC.1
MPQNLFAFATAVDGGECRTGVHVDTSTTLDATQGWVVSKTADASCTSSSLVFQPAFAGYNPLTLMTLAAVGAGCKLGDPGKACGCCASHHGHGSGYGPQGQDLQELHRDGAVIRACGQ